MRSSRRSAAYALLDVILSDLGYSRTGGLVTTNENAEICRDLAVKERLKVMLEASSAITAQISLENQANQPERKVRTPPTSPRVKEPSKISDEMHVCLTSYFHPY